LRPSVFDSRREDSYVLIVDDELSVLEVTHTMVCTLGWKPLLANTSEHALRLFREHSGVIGHVLVDLHMPGTDGAMLARELRRVRPDVRIDMMTGDAAGAETLLLDHLADGLLVKPFVLEDLEHMLESHARAA
jgi:CheY-like chemotaxis protein